MKKFIPPKKNSKAKDLINTDVSKMSELEFKITTIRILAVLEKKHRRH